MAKIQYVEKRFQAKSMYIINIANDVIDEYMRMGYTLTLRQLYYQLVAKDLIPNTQKSYNRVGSILSDGRKAGFVDWSAMVDRTRKLQAQPKWRDTGHIIGAVIDQYRLDRWEGQDYRPEVWVEKEALLDVLRAACNPLGVDYIACKGYASQSMMHDAALRFNRYRENGQEPVIIHLGDFDPSGVDMTRDNGERLSLFESETEVERIALNMRQVYEMKLPPNPAKLTDSRAKEFISLYGDKSYELDAIPVQTMVDMITEAVLEYRDEDIYDEVIERENADIAKLEKMAGL